MSIVYDSLRYNELKEFTRVYTYDIVNIPGRYIHDNVTDLEDIIKTPLTPATSRVT